MFKFRSDICKAIHNWLFFHTLHAYLQSISLPCKCCLSFIQKIIKILTKHLSGGGGGKTPLGGQRLCNFLGMKNRESVLQGCSLSSHNSAWQMVGARKLLKKNTQGNIECYNPRE